MTLIIGLLIPLLGTMLGAAFVFFMKDDLSPRVQKTLLGFASGVMVAASVWSLLIPAMEMVADSGKWSVLPAAAGFLLGIFFLLALDEDTAWCQQVYTRSTLMPEVDEMRQRTRRRIFTWSTATTVHGSIHVERHIMNLTCCLSKMFSSGHIVASLNNLQ